MAERPPSIDALARSLHDVGLPAPLLVEAARAAVAAGDPANARTLAEDMREALLRPVINATGVLLHTNLGRSPLAVTVEDAYTNLELDVASGRRGSRRAHAGHLLALACGAESALVVNNGAGAVLLVLAALARGRDVAVSRGELIEIGGGFRIPEIMAESGARLRELGTTNRTRVADYAAAVDDVALVLKVHRSNFRMSGFVEDVSTRELAALGPPVVVDLGSGLLDASCPWLPDGPPSWLRDEPAVRQTLADGASLAVFSGDKLLGGPQAGIIAGSAALVDLCARHPLYRALRPGGLVLSALQDVALLYLRREASALPFWKMATCDVSSLRERAESIGLGEVVDCASVTGGGTLPGIEIRSAGIALEGDRSAALRAAAPKPIIGRVADGRTVLDLRTVAPADDIDLAAAVKVVLCP
jgi:L-seryl-tRNA(Ser) seleniumtransferase